MKKFLALLMSMALVVSLAACSSGSSDDSEDEDTSEEETEEETEEEETEEEDTEEESEEEEDSDSADTSDNEVLKIGALVNQTGWFATYDYNNALEMEALADYYNDQGGIVIGDTTYTIEVVVEDGQSDTEGIRSAAQLLADDEDIHYVIETNDFWVESALDIFEEAGIMNIMSQNNANYDAISEDWEYSYNFFNSCPAQFYAALVFISEYYPDATSVVYCCDDNGCNDEQAALVEQYCEELGFEYIDDPIVFDAESTDLSSVALQLMNTGADVFIGNGDVTNTGSIAKELRNNGSDMIVASIVGSNASMLIEASGLDDLSNAFTMGSDLDNEENNTDIFNEVYNYFVEEYGEDTASSWCGASIENMYVLLQLMQGAGSVEVEDVREYYDSITEVETLFGTGTICGDETFGNNHIVAHPNSISICEDGEVVYGGTYECNVP